MTRVCAPGARSGFVTIPCSKSQAHRLLICAALSNAPVTLRFQGISDDIRATIRCLCALGAKITPGKEGLTVTPIDVLPQSATLPAGESGSTLRFLLPVVGALGVNAAFLMEGRLPDRPIEPLARVLCAHGMRLRREGSSLLTEGRLQPGSFTIAGDVSSQYISGLLFALPLLPADSTLTVTGPLQSAAYVQMTESALFQGKISLKKAGNSYQIAGNQRYFFPTGCTVEGDWSNAAFFLCMGAVSEKGITVRGLDKRSAQGDRAISDILRSFGAAVAERADAVFVRRSSLRGLTIDAAPIPDLIPTLCAVAALAEGETRIKNAARLRLKESDRLATTAAMLTALGADITELPDGLVIQGKAQLRGGTVDAGNDHRIAMAAAVAACGCREAVRILGSECVCKSYPRFWEDFEALQGGTV